MILLDTNVISEAMRLKPDPVVIKWIDVHQRDQLSTCTIVVAEILSGLELMPAGKRQAELREKASSMFITLFADRIWSFDQRAARAYASVLKSRRAAGRSSDGMDLLIAAIALANQAVLATRNLSDFEHTGIQLINPWD